MGPNLQFPVDLVTFYEEILNGKLHIFPVTHFKIKVFLNYYFLSCAACMFSKTVGNCRPISENMDCATSKV